MTDEEKEAYNFYKECNKKDLSAFEYFSEPSKKQIKYMETLLNLIQKQQEEIKHWKNGFERELEANRENICEIIK